MELRLDANIDVLVSSLRVESLRLHNASKDMVQDLAEFGVKAMQAHAPRGNTGILQDSMYATPVKRVHLPDGTRIWRSDIIAPAEYALAVDTGSGRYGPKGRDLQPAGNAFKMIKDPRPGRHEKRPGMVISKTVAGIRPHYFTAKAFVDIDAYARSIGLDLHI